MKWDARTVVARAVAVFGLVMISQVGLGASGFDVVGAAPPAPEPTSPLIPIPPGCSGPTPAAVIFDGTLLAKDGRTGRFQVNQVRAGSADGFAVSGLIDVRLGPDVRFLTEKQRYIVGAAPLGPNLPLGSNVREPKPTFGGNAVIELDEASLECPTLEAPLQVLHVDGTPIDTGVLTGLQDAHGRLLRAILLPALTAFAIILGLVLIRWFLTGLYNLARDAVVVDREPLIAED